MKEYPTAFSSQMVKAIQAGRKSVTRRLSKQWLKVKAGDRLWVRETLRRPDGDPWLYDADRQPVMVAPEDEMAMLVWAHHKEQDYCPSIFMPRWASRILLECEEDARPERLQDITEEEAQLEGVDAEHWVRIGGGTGVSYLLGFRSIWSTLHTKKSETWSDNPEIVRVGRFHTIQS